MPTIKDILKKSKKDLKDREKKLILKYKKDNNLLTDLEKYKLDTKNKLRLNRNRAIYESLDIPILPLNKYVYGGKKTKSNKNIQKSKKIQNNKKKKSKSN